MKVVFPYPTYWPYIRRGAERCIHDLSGYLAAQGHEVDIITSKPGAPRVTYDGAVRVIYKGPVLPTQLAQDVSLCTADATARLAAAIPETGGQWLEPLRGGHDGQHLADDQFEAFLEKMPVREIRLLAGCGDPSRRQPSPAGSPAPW